MLDRASYDLNIIARAAFCGGACRSGTCKSLTLDWTSLVPSPNLRTGKCLVTVQISGAVLVGCKIVELHSDWLTLNKNS